MHFSIHIIFNAYFFCILCFTAFCVSLKVQMPQSNYTIQSIGQFYLSYSQTEHLKVLGAGFVLVKKSFKKLKEEKGDFGSLFT